MRFTQQIKKELPAEDFMKVAPLLKKAGRLAATNEEDAYLAGILLRKAVADGALHKTIEEKVRDAAKRSAQQIYYEQKANQEFGDLSALAAMLTISGFLGVLSGIYMLMENRYVVTFHSTYLVQTIRSGGYAVILGLILLVGGIASGRQENRRKRLLRRREEVVVRRTRYW